MAGIYLQVLGDNLTDLRVREKLLRLAQFAALASGPLLGDNKRVQLERLSSDISLGRLVFRLLEDLPKWRSSFAMCSSPYIKLTASPRWSLSLLGSVCDCLYYPAEQMAWCLPIGPRAAYYKNLATKLWVLSLICSLLKSMMSVAHTSSRAKTLTVQERKSAQRQHLLAIISSSADLANGYSYLAGNNYSKSKVGVFGCVSSLIGLYKLLQIKVQHQQQTHRNKLDTIIE